jgi:hypothetical protein
MIRKLTGLLLAGTLMTAAVGFMLAPASADSARTIQDRERWGRYGSLDGKPGLNQHEVRLTIRWAAERWDVPVATALAIAERESGFNARAVNSSSGACGVYQAYGPDPQRTFLERVRKFNREVPNGNAGPSCFNGRSNVIVHVRIMGRSLSPWD